MSYETITAMLEDKITFLKLGNWPEDLDVWWYEAKNTVDEFEKVMGPNLRKMPEEEFRLFCGHYVHLTRQMDSLLSQIKKNAPLGAQRHDYLYDQNPGEQSRIRYMKQECYDCHRFEQFICRMKAEEEEEEDWTMREPTLEKIGTDDLPKKP
jgi:hypothetical protein